MYQYQQNSAQSVHVLWFRVTEGFGTYSGIKFVENSIGTIKNGSPYLPTPRWSFSIPIKLSEDTWNDRSCPPTEIRGWTINGRFYKPEHEAPTTSFVQRKPLKSPHERKRFVRRLYRGEFSSMQSGLQLRLASPCCSGYIRRHVGVDEIFNEFFLKTDAPFDLDKLLRVSGAKICKEACASTLLWNILIIGTWCSNLVPVERVSVEIIEED